jgi:hypothetical protein
MLKKPGRGRKNPNEKLTFAALVSGGLFDK